MEYDIVRERLQAEFGELCEDRMPTVVLSDAGAIIITLQGESNVLRVDIPLYGAEAMDGNEQLFKRIAQLNGSATAQHHQVFYSLAPSNTLYLSSLLNYRCIESFDVIVNKINAIVGSISLLKEFIVDYINQTEKTQKSKASDLYRKFSFA